MSVLLIVVGAVVLVAGIGALGFGIPINEFSFGNTLIEAGTTAVVGGLVLIGLGAIVTQLQRVADGLAMWTPSRPDLRTPESVGPAAAEPPRATRSPYPRRPPAKPHTEPASLAAFDHAPQPEPEPAQTISPRPETLAEVPAAEQPSGAPSLHNPDIPPVETGDEVSLSPVEPQPTRAPEPAKAARSEPLRETLRPSFGLNALRPSAPPPPPVSEAPSPVAATPAPPSSEFDEMWPALEPKSGQTAAGGDSKVEPTLEQLPPLPDEQEPGEIAGPPQSAIPPSEPPRAVAILKSGVVDGMGYTLYVDGSIEAELPQGTLRFSSINDLRNYLEKNA
jgi:hypothetical protein